MKKQITVILCCLAFVLSSIAQPEKGLKLEKFIMKNNFNKLKKQTHFKGEKTDFLQLSTSFHKIQNKAPQFKSADWWEPEFIYMYDDELGDSRRSFTYKNGKCDFVLIQEWQNNQWNDEYKLLYTYDLQNNKMIELVGQHWANNHWQNSRRETYAYDNNDNNVEILGYDWNMEDWEMDERTILTYNECDNLIEELYQYYYDDEWENEMLITNTYDEQCKLTEILYKFWEEDWEVGFKIAVTYDEQNRVSFHTYKWWDDDDEWIEDYRIVFSYDFHNNLIEELEQYKWGDEVWKNEDRIIYEYDENNNAISGLSQWWTGSTWFDASWNIFQVYYNNMQSKEYAAGNRFTATYIDPNNVNVNEGTLLKNTLKIYPNPVSDILYIEKNNINETPEVKIYSIQGVLLMNIKGNQIDVSSLQNGIYIAEIDGSFRKFVKQ